MMVEAIHLYRMVVVVFGIENKFIISYMGIGWGMFINRFITISVLFSDKEQGSSYVRIPIHLGGNLRCTCIDHFTKVRLYSVEVNGRETLIERSTGAQTGRLRWGSSQILYTGSLVVRAFQKTIIVVDWMYLSTTLTHCLLLQSSPHTSTSSFPFPSATSGVPLLVTTVTTAIGREHLNDANLRYVTVVYALIQSVQECSIPKNAKF